MHQHRFTILVVALLAIVGMMSAGALPASAFSQRSGSASARALPTTRLVTIALGEVALAEHNLLMNHADAARAHLSAFLDQPGMAEHPRMVEARVIALPALAWAEAELGHDAEAAERLEQAIAMATARRLRLRLVDAVRVKGLLAVRRQRWEDARAALDEAITMSRAMPYPYAELKALYVYGQLEAARGDPAAARERFEQALAICDRLGEGLYRKRIERDLAALKSSARPSRQ